MKKYTEGPWKVDGFNVVTAENLYFTQRFTVRHNGELRANANLISAAPELLEAIESFLNGVEAHADADMKKKLSYHIMRMGTAIAKAHGKETCCDLCEIHGPGACKSDDYDNEEAAEESEDE